MAVNGRYAGKKQAPNWGHAKYHWIRSRPSKPNQSKGQKEMFMNFSPIFVWFLVFFLGKTRAIHIELLIHNGPRWPFLGLVCRGDSWRMCPKQLFSSSFGFFLCRLVWRRVLHLQILRGRASKPPPSWFTVLLKPTSPCFLCSGCFCFSSSWSDFQENTEKFWWGHNQELSARGVSKNPCSTVPSEAHP